MADGKQNIASLKVGVEKSGFSPDAISACLSKLVNTDKLVKRVSNGVYALTVKGRNALGEAE